MRKGIAGAFLALCSASALLADFQYQQSTKITGGAMAGMMKMAGTFSKSAREPIVTEIYVKGNRMAHVTAHGAQIYDIDKETVTHVDFDRKQYYTMTFAQMKQAAEDAVARAKQQKTEGSENADMKFSASVKETGASRVVSGINTKGFILTLMMEGSNKNTGEKGAMSMTNDLWMAPEIKGYQEVRDFQMRMAEKMGMSYGGGSGLGAMMARPDMTKAMAEMAKEMSKLKGTPVLTVSRMGSTADGKPVPAASEAPAAAQTESPDVKEAGAKAATSAAMDRLGGLAGGLGGFGRKKKQDQPAQTEQPKQQQAQSSGPAILMESTSESSGFSSAPVDPAKFEVPAGFKQVEPESRRRGR